MAFRLDDGGYWMRKTEDDRSTETGRRNKKARAKKFLPLDLNVASEVPEVVICEYDSSLVLVSVPRDGFCLFHSVIRAQKSYPWGDPYLSLSKLIELVEKESFKNVSLYSCYFIDSEQGDFEALLLAYLYEGDFDSSLGDVMPLILSNTLQIKIRITQDSADPLTVEPNNSLCSYLNEIHLHLNQEHYQPFVNRYL